MPSGLQNFAEMEFEGDGSESESMEFLVMCAEVVGNITRDEQCLGIAEGLSRMTGAGRTGIVGNKGSLSGPQRQPTPVTPGPPSNTSPSSGGMGLVGG